MSVRKDERKEGELQVLNACAKLTRYSIDRCSSEKIFPKKNRWIMSNKVADTAINIMINIQSANSVFVSSKSDYELRRRYQNIAHANISALLGLIDIAYQCFEIEHRVVEFWTELAVEADSKLVGWMRSDKKRYKDYV